MFQIYILLFVYVNTIEDVRDYIQYRTYSFSFDIILPAALYVFRLCNDFQTLYFCSNFIKFSSQLCNTGYICICKLIFQNQTQHSFNQSITII